ncbi:uncharacterized protein ACA1_182180 [Acanthamoeba castellanii str. Neff]|uniref:PAS domain-containing protein n=1 Tax=Acanthamoeba castellanii (strain ATCC 30010 / Neff) TaxID=1257118 RepID=L8H7U7_ACACF|nr:uncharacterized protein ACA1_182180 [Acanthamoeba castellanii str. Neff]ELR21317.1 hypothetical protein ACA1_182180 [Acanthamoeba castellanii str. Neff]
MNHPQAETHVVYSAPEPTTKKRARSVRNGPGDVHQRLPKKSFQARPQVLWSSPQAAEHHHEHDDDDGAPSMVSGAVAMVVSAVEALAAEVRALRDDNRHIHVQLDAMKARQHACDSALASLLHGNHYQQSTVGSAPRKVRKASARLTGNRSCENAEERPSAAVLEAIRELTFLDDYPSLTGFAVPDFRFPVLACAYAGAGSRPTIIYANAAACQLTEYSWGELIGAPLSTVVAMADQLLVPSQSPDLGHERHPAISPVYNFHHVLRSKSGRLWRASADNTQFFFNATQPHHVRECSAEPRHALISVTQWVRLAEPGSVVPSTSSIESVVDNLLDWVEATTPAEENEPSSPSTSSPELASAPTTAANHQLQRHPINLSSSSSSSSPHRPTRSWPLLYSVQ